MNPTAVGPAPESSRGPSPALRLFTLSFIALFLELMVIRWVPSEVRLVAYYANLMLVSSFLGLGIGAILSARGWNLFRLFPLFLTVDIGFLVALGGVSLPGSAGELRLSLVDHRALAYISLVLVFSLNALVFVPLGEKIGVQFQRLPPLRAYVWDLLGSLGGTLAFGLFSLLHFSPVAGLAILIALVVLSDASARRGRALVLYSLALAAVVWSGQRDTMWWSPYYFITVRENRVKLNATEQPGVATASFEESRVAAPPADLGTMQDPPLYSVRVNQDFYQMHGTIDPRRYPPGSTQQQLVAVLRTQYDLPYHVTGKPARVLVLGAGGGMDVETALLHGAQRVDAVEIDPVIPRLSARFNAAQPYAKANVVLHIGDARAFLQKNRDLFDLVVFGHLDSQALFSYGNSLRLDGYTYTVEGFRAAFARVAPGGTMSVSFSVNQEWLAQKFAQMLALATGAEPFIYAGTGTFTFIASKNPHLAPAAHVGTWQLRRAALQPVDLATDDWPYLYLQKRGIPSDYAMVIGGLLTLSVGALWAFRGRGFARSDGHFLFLGWGFMLLQTKSIGDCSLYFGTTWLVTTIVIAGVLLMVLLANWVTQRFLLNFHPWLYVPLFLSLATVLAIPREAILAQELGWRVAWTLTVVPLPIFFAGLIFSSTFREASQPALAFGANLIGAMLGGFCEYLGMWVGSQALGAIVATAYALSLLCLLGQRRADKLALPPSMIGVHSAPP